VKGEGQHGSSLPSGLEFIEAFIIEPS